MVFIISWNFRGYEITWEYFQKWENKKKLQKLFNTLKMEFMIQLGEYNIKHEESVSYLQR